MSWFLVLWWQVHRSSFPIRLPVENNYFKRTNNITLLLLKPITNRLIFKVITIDCNSGSEDCQRIWRSCFRITRDILLEYMDLFYFSLIFPKLEFNIYLSEEFIFLPPLIQVNGKYSMQLVKPHSLFFNVFCVY